MWPMHENMFSVMDPDRIIHSHINHMEFVAPAIQRMRHINFLDDMRDRANVERVAKLLNFLNSFISVLQTTYYIYIYLIPGF